ncbi:hypothetical protein B0H10DRAFT_1776295 [Mycena sp. CBHHK59/15]|nr:hypothetical protein B0H10DRAFT_1776295 [Mycena sp. CBHHK59/15]
MAQDLGPVPLSFEDGKLTTGDIIWREMQPWLQDCGYMLRPRFRPGWVPSWKTSGQFMVLCEDSYVPISFALMDAVRIADNTLVMLKHIHRDLELSPDEAEIWGFLSSDQLRADPKNHCIPLLDVLEPPGGQPGDKILVMKFMHDFSEPYYDTVGEGVDFFRQMFEGLKSMHDHGVAHRDCSVANIMMDAQQLYPDGFSPRLSRRTPDLKADARHLTRTQAPPRYYFIDFGLSMKFDETQPRLASPIRGGDRFVPEIEDNEDETLVDPFAVDIWCVGHLIQLVFLDGWTGGMEDVYPGMAGFEFIRPLVTDMTLTDPQKRPKIDEVVSRFEAIVSGLSSWKLRSRVRKKSDFYLDIPEIAKHWYRRIGYIIRRVPPIPVQPT